MVRFGGNDALDYFAKDILKGNKFLKRWCYINTQTTYVKQHKHVNFIPRNVIDHHQLIIEGDTGKNWKMTFNYERIIFGDFQQKLRLMIIF